MTAPQHGNGYDPERTKQCVDRIEAIDREKERLHMEYMGECSRLAEDRNAVYDEAKNAWGIPKRALKTVIKVRATERKLEAMRENLEPDDQESFDQIRHALGDLADTPLGRAATGESDDEEDVRSTEQQERVPGGRRGKRRGDDALNAAATDGAPHDNGGSKLADGLKTLQ